MSKLHIIQEDHAIKTFWQGLEKSIVTQHAAQDHRPFLHPILAPDGVGELTEYSPGHHPHQTGLYWGFTRVNGSGADAGTLKEWFYNRNKPDHIQDQIGRDFFHNPGGDFWQRVSASVITPSGSKVEWQTVYNMLDNTGKTILGETQQWSVQVQDDMFLIDLNWRGEAKVNVTINEFSYGGLFLRMPYRKENGGLALNSEGASNQDAEGQRAQWVAVEMPIPGREENPQPDGFIAILNHPTNPDHPLPWRVDGQLGVGPCRAILGDWALLNGNSVNFRHRLVVGGGKLDQQQIAQEWQRYAKS